MVDSDDNRGGGGIGEDDCDGLVSTTNDDGLHSPLLSYCHCTKHQGWMDRLGGWWTTITSARDIWAFQLQKRGLRWKNLINMNDVLNSDLI